MEKHLLQHMKQRLQYLEGFVAQIEKHAKNVETMWERYHDPRRQDSLVNPRQFVLKCEELKNSNIEPIKREISDLLSHKLARPIESALNAILELLSQIEQEYSKGFNQIRDHEGEAYLVSEVHVLQKTRGIRNNLEAIYDILKTYVE